MLGMSLILQYCLRVKMIMAEYLLLTTRQKTVMDKLADFCDQATDQHMKNEKHLEK
jgi:hypothetical protein